MLMLPVSVRLSIALRMYWRSVASFEITPISALKPICSDVGSLAISSIVLISSSSARCLKAATSFEVNLILPLSTIASTSSESIVSISSSTRPFKSAHASVFIAGVITPPFMSSSSLVCSFASCLFQNSFLLPVAFSAFAVRSATRV